MPDIFDQGCLALPPAGERAPAVLVIHAWWGLNAFFHQLCDRLAQAGFVACASDLYDGKVAETIEQAESLSNLLDSAKALERLGEAIEALRRHPRANGQPVGVIGFSLGAFLGLSLLQTFPDQIGALVLFYGTRPGAYPNTQAAVLAHFAETDEYESERDQKNLEAALKAAGVATTFYTYPGTGHWFFESNQAKAYKADAAELAWARTLGFLKEHL